MTEGNGGDAKPPLGPPPGSALDPTMTNISGPARLAVEETLAGRYRILDLLGMGAMGMVYRAHDDELDIDIALKVLRPEFAKDAKLLERFRRELVLARQVTHKHVVRIHDLGRDGDLTFLTMDLVQGRSLRQILEEKERLSTEEAVVFAEQLARALAAAHDGGVIHRDLKPSNVMVDDDGNAYITDFGVARSVAAGGSTRTGFIVGTPDYLSPEQVRGEDIDGRADIYALGVLLYELLTGNLPGTGRTADETLAQHLQGVPSRLAGLPADVPANLRAILKRCLEPDRRRRYANAADVARDLRNLSKPPWQLPSMRRLTAASGAVLLLIAGLVLWSKNRSSTASRTDADGALAIVILPFANETNRADLAWLTTGVPELLFESLIEQPELRVVNPQRVAQAVADLKLEPGSFSESTLALASELFDADRLMTGVVRTNEVGGLRIDAQLANPATGTASTIFLHAEAPAGSGATSKAVADLQISLLKNLSVKRLPGNAPLASAALPEYGKGVQKLWAGEFIEAQSLLEKATQEDPDFGAGWLRLSQAYEAMGRYDQALAASDRAVKQLEQGADANDRLSLLAQAQQARLSGDPNRAQQILRQVVEAFPGDVESALELADAFGSEGQFPEALDLLRRIVESEPANAQAWFLRAKYSILSGQSRPAVDEYLVQALVLQNKLKNRQGQADVMNAFGVGYRELGEMEQAEASYRQAADLRAELGDRRGYATSLRNLAQVSIFRGDFAAAEENLRSASETFEELGDQQGISDLYNELGIMEESRSDYQAALEYFRTALQIRRDLGDQRAIAESLNNIGFANHQLGKYDDASVYWQQALDLYRETENVEGQATVHQGLGQLYTTRGDWQEAQQALVQALAGARQLQSQTAIAVAEGYLGRVAQFQGRYAAALSYYDEALGRFEELGDGRGLVDFSLAKAETLLELGTAEEVLKLLEDLGPSLKAVGNSDHQANALRMHGKALFILGDENGGAKALSGALEASASSTNQALKLRIRLADLVANGSLAGLEQLTQQTRALGDKYLELSAEMALVEALLENGRPDQALAAVNRIERLVRRTGDWSQAFRLFDSKAELARLEGDDSTEWLAARDREIERITDGLAPERVETLRNHHGLEISRDAA